MSQRLFASLAAVLSSAALAWGQSPAEPSNASAPTTAVSEQPEQPVNLLQADNPKGPAPVAQTPDLSGPAVIGSVDPVAPVGQGRFYAVSEATFFKPRFSGAAGGSLSPAELPGSTFFGPFSIPTTGSGGGVADFHHEGDWRGWLGFETASGLGFRTCYSHYHSSSYTVAVNQAGSEFILIVPIVEATVQQAQSGTLDTALRMQVLDLEATYEVTFGNWSILGAVGARWAKLQRQAQLNESSALSASGVAIIVGPFSASEQIQTFTETTQEYQNWGPTAALELRYGLSSGRLAVAWFTNLRCSQLSGNTHIYQNSASTDTITLETVLDPTLTTSTSSSSVFSRPVTTVIGELEIGGEVGYLTRFGEFFFRASYEWQRWNEGGSALGVSAHGDALYLSGFTVGGGWRF